MEREEKSGKYRYKLYKLQKVIQYFEKRGVEMQEESEDVTVDEKE